MIFLKKLKNLKKIKIEKMVKPLYNKQFSIILFEKNIEKIEKSNFTLFLKNKFLHIFLVL